MTLKHFLSYLFCFLISEISAISYGVSEQMQMRQDKMDAELAELREKCQRNEEALLNLSQENSELKLKLAAGNRRKSTDSKILKEMSDSLLNLKADLHYLMSSTPERKKRSNIENTDLPANHITLEFHNMKQDILGIKLLENREFPQLHSNMDSQQQQLNKVLNLTSQLTLELNRMKAAETSQDQLAIKYQPSELDKIRSELATLQAMFHKLSENQKWAEFIIELHRKELRNFTKQLTEQMSAISQSLKVIKNKTVRYPQKLFAGLLGDDESEEFSGSGETPEVENASFPQFQNDMWYHDLLAEILKFRQQLAAVKQKKEKSRHWAQESLEAVKIFDRRLSKVENSLAKIHQEVYKCKLDKADKSTTDILLKSLGRLKSKFRQFSVEAETKATFVSANFSQVLQSLSKIRQASNKAVFQSNRALTVSEVIKEVQTDHFTAIENFKTDLNFVKTDILKFGLKLTTLQADFLNSTLYLYQTSKKDLHQDQSIAEANLGIQQNQKLIEQYSNVLSSLEKAVNDKVDYYSWRQVDTQVDLVSAKIGQLTRDQRDSNLQLNSNNKRLANLEYPLPPDCSMKKNLEEIRYKSGVYLIKPAWLNRTVLVYCDMKDAGGNWTLIQRRSDGLTNFNRTWAEYALGFGDPAGSDFWIGNEVLHSLTAKVRHHTTGDRLSIQLRVETWDIYGDYRFADYSSMHVENRSNKFRLNLGNILDGNLTDSLRYHNNMEFSSADADFDASSTHCAKYYGAGWWYSHCQKVNLNGNFHIGMVWFDNVTSDWLHLKRTSMKIRPTVIV